MTDGEYIAAEMIGVVVVTALAVCLLRRRKMEGAVVAGGFVAGAFLGGVVLTGLGHMCHAGAPYRQAAVLGVCVAVVLSVVHSRRVAWATCVAITGVMVLASWQFVQLVHTREFVGSLAGVAMRNRAIRIVAVKRIGSLLAEEDVDGEVAYPAGWVADLPLSDLLTDAGVDYLKVRELREVLGLWHSPLTGLYGVGYEPVELWYPGGVLEDGVAGIRYEKRSVGGERRGDR